MIQQTKNRSFTSTAAKPKRSGRYDFVNDRCREGRQRTNARYDLTRPLLSVPDIQVVSCNDRQGIPDPPATLRGAMEKGLAGLFMGLTIAAGLFFVVWFFYALVMGLATFEVNNFAHMIRG